MNRKIVICGLFKYPRGCAAANYIQYLSDALILGGYDVTIVCDINPEYSREKQFIYRGAKIIEIMSKEHHTIVNRLLNGKLFKERLYRLLKSMGINENDVIISGRDKIIREPIMRLYREIGFKNVSYLLEWFPKEHYASRRQGEEAYRVFFASGDLDLIFPISHYIAEQFENRKAKVVVLPIMADKSEYQFVPKKVGKYQFILPAMGMMKDALGEMLLGLAELSAEELQQFDFHITGVKEEKAREILEVHWDKVKPTLIFHSWMQYDTLIDLYRECHYLFLARETNQMTLANFPSKVPETMSHGIVPVCSKVGEYTQYYLQDNVNSLVFSGCSREKCAAAIRRALNVPFEQYQILSANARKCVDERFDYHNWVGTIRDSIESLFVKEK